jgi:competence ComEA-like helix-hairpin-helix protein
MAGAIIRVLEGRLSEKPFGIDLNTASAAELARIPRFGSSRIAALIAYRTSAGSVSRLEDLGGLPGFGPAMIEHLRLYVHV